MKSTVAQPEWPLGYYGLVKCNDPDFIFKEIPRIDPLRGVNPDKDKKAYEAWLIWASETDDMEKNFKCEPELGYELYKACLKAGYRPKRDGFRLSYWLRDHMGKKMKRANTLNIKKNK